MGNSKVKLGVVESLGRYMDGMSGGDIGMGPWATFVSQTGVLPPVPCLLVCGNSDVPSWHKVLRRNITWVGWLEWVVA